MSMRIDESITSSATRRYLAICDVLGFSQLVETTSLEDVYLGFREIINHALASSKAREGRIYHPDGRIETRLSPPSVGISVFSDSIIVWSQPQSPDSFGDPRDGLQAALFFKFIGHLILWGLRRTSCGLRFPIRAGIAYGAVIVLPEEQIYLGRPIVDAHRMEQAQEWVGAACHPSCWQAPDFEIVRDEKGQYRYVEDYPVPLHPGRRFETGDSDLPTKAPLAVTWPGMIWTLPEGPEDYYMKNIEDILRVEGSLPGTPSSVAQKWKNTLAFGKRFREFRDPEDKEPW